MTQTSFALMTVLGRAKEAAALANGTAIQITEIAIGDGATVPSGGETQLYNEVDRFPISGHGTVAGAANVAYFDAYLSASDGPYTIREAGLYDSQGDLIAIAHYNPAISKPVPSSGQTVEATVRLEVAFSNVASIVISVDPSMTVPLQRLSRLPWIPVLSMTVTSPPASPAAGDAYLVPAGATGAWSGHAGKVAEYTTAGWAMIVPPEGHGISLPDGRVFEKIGGVYTEFLASRAWVNARTVATTKLNRLPWIPVTSMTTATPPANPAAGAAYLVPAGATGVWSGHAGKVAEWIDNAWSYTTPVDGHAICLPNNQIFVRTGGQYAALAASLADAVAGLSAVQYISPATLIAFMNARFGNSSQLLASANPVFPEIENATGRMTINVTGASIVVATGQTWMHRGIFRYSTDSYTLAQRTFPVAANSEYHLRWTPNQGFSLRSLNDTSYNPGGVAGFFEVFDTSYDDMLVASISVGASASAITVTPLVNRSRLQARATITDSVSIVTTGSGNDGIRVTSTLALQWSRTPFYSVSGHTANTGAIELHGYANRVSVTVATRHVISAYVESDYNGVIDGTALGAVQFSAFA